MVKKTNCETFSKSDEEKSLETLGVRVPREWMEIIDNLSSATNRNRTTIAREAIGQYLQQNIDTIPDRITALESKIAQVNDKLTVDTGIVAPLNQRLDKLEDILQAILQALGDIKPEIKIVEKLRETISDGERYGGITQTELLEKYQLSYHVLDKEAKEKGIPFHQLVKEKTGWYKKDPNKRRSRWLPLENNVNTTVRQLNGNTANNGKEPTLVSDINDSSSN
ncbi:ribbon-helix-helix protein, CopG family [Scytonema hofmannii FACHB-248]|uniref:Ribbon-helix-helix protein, CopG family n=1 Tax=Scytonema hofmannii FACHB-248 TaxID=1842502 RepID=A0ABR8H1P2_9CYAN|nr:MULTISPECIES: ribbon-helix-helix protein, CopG family [Nostocales]MBD2609384.1 ribbon-helix-helix protein, CopG family [Scytonema hofmannii FACHB-248]